MRTLEKKKSTGPRNRYGVFSILKGVWSYRSVRERHRESDIQIEGDGETKLSKGTEMWNNND